MSRVQKTKVGDVNYCVAFYGAVESGKTTGAMQYMIDLGRQYKAYKFAHDTRGRLPKALPDGKRTDVKFYRDMNEMYALMGQETSGIHVIPSNGVESLTIASAYSKATWETIGDDDYGYPSIIMVDEVVTLRESAPRQFDAEFLSFVTGRRHEHTAIIYTAQSPYLAHRQLRTHTNEMFLYRMTDEYDLRCVARMAQDKSLIDRLPQLKPAKDGGKPIHVRL